MSLKALPIGNSLNSVPLNCLLDNQPTALEIDVKLVNDDLVELLKTMPRVDKILLTNATNCVETQMHTNTVAAVSLLKDHFAIPVYVENQRDH